MDNTSFDLYILMVSLMAAAIFCIPMIARRVKRITVILGFVPPLICMAIDAQDPSMRGTPWDPFVIGIMMMFLCPLLAVLIQACMERICGKGG